MLINWFLRLFQRVTTEGNFSSVQQTTQMKRYWYVELAKITSRFLCNLESKNNFSAGSGSSSCKVSHEWLDTLWEHKWTNNRNYAPSPKTITPAKKQTNYQLTRAITLSSVCAHSLHLSITHKPQNSTGTLGFTLIYFTFHFSYNWRIIIINYLLPRVRSLRENLKLRPCRIDRVITRPIQQGRDLRFSRKNRKFEVNK